MLQRLLELDELVQQLCPLGVPVFLDRLRRGTSFERVFELVDAIRQCCAVHGEPLLLGTKCVDHRELPADFFTRDIQ